MKTISKKDIEQVFSFREFVPFLKEFLTKDIIVPDRAHYSIPTKSHVDATLLTMPAWTADDHIGVKIVNVFPENKSIPTINGAYILSSGKTGETMAVIDGLALTLKRTAAVSALASTMLSRPDATSLLMIGTGNLCHALIQAHASVRDLDQVWIWGRNYSKAKEKAATISLPNINIEAIETKDKFLSKADIVSTATLSQDPLVFGEKLKESVYLDLVGSYKKDSREADNKAIQNANIFVDTYNAKNESGDIYIPLAKGIITTDDILSDLSMVCKKSIDINTFKYRKTFFKSVGFGGPDLAAAIYLYNKLSR